MEFHIVRTGYSKYFQPDFQAQEQESLSWLLEQTESRGKFFPDLEMLNQFSWQDLGDHRFILITNTQTDLSKIRSEILNKTSLIIHPNSGYDNFEFEQIIDLGVPLIIGSEIRADAVSEYIVSAIIHHFAPLPKDNQWNELRTWKRSLISGKKVLIIGSGVVGKKTQLLLNALGTQLFVEDPYKNISPSNEFDASEMDVVILAASLNSSSYHLINDQFLQKLKSDCVVVNPARGQLINQEHLINWLEHNSQAAAYLDVLSEEPPKNSSIYNISNLYLSSHIAGVFAGIDQKIIDFEVKVIEDFIRLSQNKFKKKYSSLNLQNRAHPKEPYFI